MAAPTMQKQTARNLVASANTQTAYGGVLADAALTRRMTVDASSMFSNETDRYNDQGAVGHGTDFATVDILTGRKTAGMLKGMGGTDTWALGQWLSLIFGSETVTGSASPYTHVFTMPNISSIAPCTTFYVEDTYDVKRKYQDMAAKSFMLDIPERGPVNATIDMVGTGLFTPGAFATALPAVPVQNFLLGSDMRVSITPLGGAATLFSGRQKSLSFKIDRNTAPFDSSGDGYVAGSCQYGKFSCSLDLTIMAQETDDVNGWCENLTQLAVSVVTDPSKTFQLQINFPVARFKATKLGNVADLVAWQLSLDQSTILQVAGAPALSVTLLNECAAYLIPA